MGAAGHRCARVRSSLDVIDDDVVVLDDVAGLATRLDGLEEVWSTIERAHEWRLNQVQDEAEYAGNQQKKQHDENYYPSSPGLHADSLASQLRGTRVRL